MITIQIQSDPIHLQPSPASPAKAEPSGGPAASGEDIPTILEDRDDCGAEVRFIGKVRNDARTAPITHLVLEHFPGVTEAEIQRIVDQAHERWSLQKARVVHRVGSIPVGEVIVLVETASSHRRDAYEANVFIMDYLKTEAPFWKKECYADGTERWVEAKQSDQRAARRWASDQTQRLHLGALVLAGGEGSRMGNVNKGLQLLHGKPMVQHVIEVLRPHVQYMAISANQGVAVYQAMGVPVFSDEPRWPVRGPLAGILAAATQFPGNLDAVIVVPCDMPRLPNDLVPRMAQALFASHASVVIARTRSEGREHHHAVFMCRGAVFASLLSYTLGREDHSLMGWLNAHSCEPVYFEDADAFLNVNDPAMLARLESGQ